MRPGIDPAQWAAAIGVNVVAVARLTIMLLPVMLANKWGRIVNISSGIAAQPAGMLRANAYVTSKAALEAHTLNLAAELAGHRGHGECVPPGPVDTAMQAWIRAQDPAKIGAALHQRFATSHQEGNLISPQQSARSLLSHLHTGDTGRIWNVTDPA